MRKMKLMKVHYYAGGESLNIDMSVTVIEQGKAFYHKEKGLYCLDEWATGLLIRKFCTVKEMTDWWAQEENKKRVKDAIKRLKDSGRYEELNT